MPQKTKHRMVACRAPLLFPSSPLIPPFLASSFRSLRSHLTRTTVAFHAGGTGSIARRADGVQETSHKRLGGQMLLLLLPLLLNVDASCKHATSEGGAGQQQQQRQLILLLLLIQLHNF